MGGQQSILKEVELGEPLPDDSRLYQTWTNVFPGRFRGQISVTVFIRDFEEVDLSETRKFFENGIQVLKQLRHPAILGYCTSSLLSDQALLMTERCRPLDLLLDNVEAVEILDGLNNLLAALVFLHDRAGMCHNNVCPTSIFVTKDGSWKLGSFECALKTENSRHWVASNFVKTIKEPVFVPPEDQQLMKKDAPPHSRDSYGFGKVIEYLLPFLDSKLEESQIAELAGLAENLTQDAPASRPRLSSLVGSSAFRNDLTQISEFLLHIPVKDPDSKDAFFRNLIPRLKKLPASVVARRLAQSLLSRYVLLEPVAVTEFLPVFLKTAETDEENRPLLSQSEFQRFCCPELAKIFCVHETAVRLALLQNFHHFASAFKAETLERVILPEVARSYDRNVELAFQLLLGMKDADEAIVAASMCGLALLVPLLGAEKVTGLQHRKYFAEGRPRAMGKLPEPSELQNIKNALESDPEASRKYDVAEKKRQRLEKAEERRKQMEEKRLLKKNTTLVEQIPPKTKGNHAEPVKRVKEEKIIDDKGSSVVEPEKHDEATEQEIIPSEPGPIVEDEEEWSGWDEEAPAPTPPPIILPASKKVPLKLTPKVSTEVKKEKPLGAEFDILALDVKEIPTAEEEIDFFADMTPSVGSKKTTDVPRPANMFQMALADDLPNSVWENDDGWGDED